jgi:hypothetical protein
MDSNPRSPVAVTPDGNEQQCEVTIKEGMLDETSLIMVVDKSATITVNSHVRLGSLSSWADARSSRSIGWGGRPPCWRYSLRHAVSFGPFRLLPDRRLLLEGDRPVRLGAAPGRISACFPEVAGAPCRPSRPPYRFGGWARTNPSLTSTPKSRAGQRQQIVWKISVSAIEDRAQIAHPHVWSAQMRQQRQSVADLGDSMSHAHLQSL